MDLGEFGVSMGNGIWRTKQKTCMKVLKALSRDEYIDLRTPRGNERSFTIRGYISGMVVQKDIKSKSDIPIRIISPKDFDNTKHMRSKFERGARGKTLHEGAF